MRWFRSTEKEHLILLGRTIRILRRVDICASSLVRFCQSIIQAQTTTREKYGGNKITNFYVLQYNS